MSSQTGHLRMPYIHRAKDALFMMPTHGVLDNAVDQLDGIGMTDRSGA